MHRNAGGSPVASLEGRAGVTGALRSTLNGLKMLENLAPNILAGFFNGALFGGDAAAAVNV